MKVFILVFIFIYFEPFLPCFSASFEGSTGSMMEELDYRKIQEVLDQSGGQSFEICMYSLFTPISS